MLRSDVVRNLDGRAGVCFRKCRCGSQAAPYEIISILPRPARSSGGKERVGTGGKGIVEEGESRRTRWENSSAAARIIRKINYFPGLLINFTIAPASLPCASRFQRSYPSSVRGCRSERGAEGKRATRKGERELEIRAFTVALVCLSLVCARS